MCPDLYPLLNSISYRQLGTLFLVPHQKRMLYIAISLTGDLLGCFSSPVDAHELIKRYVGSTVTQCNLNSEVDTLSPDCVLGIDGSGSGPCCQALSMCSSGSAIGKPR